MTTIENLTEGQFLITEAKMVKGDKVQLEFAQMVNLPNKNNSIIGLLNVSDERFNSAPKARRAWLSGVKADIEKLFSVDLSTLTNEDDTVELNILNPTINGQPLNIQFVETTKGSTYDLANIDTRAKRAGKDGEYIYTAEGQHIFTNTTVVTGEPKHFFFENTTRQVKDISAGIMSEIDKEIAA